jgi:hypothetical protein
LLSEEGEIDSFTSLICLDLSRNSLQKLQTVEYPFGYSHVFVDMANPTTFLLTDEESTRICKIAENRIIIGDVIEIDFDPDCFYDKYVYGLEWNNDTRVSWLFKCLIL